MKAGWQQPRFGDICDLKKGKKPTLETYQSQNTKPYLVAKYLRGAEPTDFAAVGDRNSIPVSTDEIIIICDGSNSGETFIGFDGILSSTMAKVAHGKEVDTRFLLHFLDSLFEKFNASKTGSAIPHLDLPALRNEVLPLPTIEEQHRIVAILDEAFDGIATAKANAEKNLLNARAIFESHREVLLSFKQEWLDATLADLCDVKHGYAFEGEFFAAEGDYVLLTPGSFFESGGYRERGEKTKYFVGPIPGDYILASGDLLVAMTEQAVGLLGSPLLVPDSNRFLHNQRLGLVTGKKGVPWLNEFFFHVPESVTSNSPKFQSDRNHTGGTHFPA